MSREGEYFCREEKVNFFVSFLWFFRVEVYTCLYLVLIGHMSNPPILLMRQRVERVQTNNMIKKKEKKRKKTYCLVMFEGPNVTVGKIIERQNIQSSRHPVFTSDRDDPREESQRKKKTITDLF